MKKLLLFAIIILTLGLAACTKITKGTVIEKYTTEPYTYMYPVKAGKVTTYTPVRVPKKWHIVIKGQTDSGKDVKEDFTVSKSNYDKYSEGDQFDYEALEDKSE